MINKPEFLKEEKINKLHEYLLACIEGYPDKEDLQLDNGLHFDFGEYTYSVTYRELLDSPTEFVPLEQSVTFDPTNITDVEKYLDNGTKTSTETE